MHELVHYIRGTPDLTPDEPTEAQLNGGNFDFNGPTVNIVNTIALELGVTQPSYFNDIRTSYEATIQSSDYRFGEFQIGVSYSGGNPVDIVRIGDFSGIEANNLDMSARTDDSRDLLFGLGGNDTINGGGGTDYIYGGVGNDSIIGSEGNDLTDGGAGTDILDFSASSDNVTVDLFTRAVLIEQTLLGVVIDSELQSVYNIENVTTGSGNDILIGDGSDNALNGGLGNDRLLGGIGNDSYIFSGAYGRDVLTDADGLGSITIGGTLLTGAASLSGEAQNEWTLNGHTLLLDADNSLTIDGANANSITIRNFTSGQLGMGIMLH